MSEIIDRTAAELAAAIRQRRLSSVEVVGAFLARIDAVEDQVGAFISRADPDVALADAAAADRRLSSGGPVGLLHGLPTAVKDLADVAGLPTTHGSAAYRDAPPASTDSLLAERLRGEGAIFVGKTNTPQHGLGTVTFNDVRGVARNPWDLTANAGGSSGGAAAAVAARMLPFADGSDSGGSIRYPAGFCNLVGLRPSPGRIPSGRGGDAFNPHGVTGPIAQTAHDAGLLLAALSGPDPRAPLSFAEDPSRFLGLLPRPIAGLRIAWSPTGGGLPVAPDVLSVLAPLMTLLGDHGAVVTEIGDELFDQADECWQIIEMLGFLTFGAGDVGRFGDAMGGDFVRNVEEGRALTAEQIVRGLTLRTEVFRRVASLLTAHDVLALPTTPLVSIPADEPWPRAVAGVVCERYFDWQRLACRVTVTAHPAVSVPGGFHMDRHPVGLQLVGRHRGELDLLRIAAAVEAVTGATSRRAPL